MTGFSDYYARASLENFVGKTAMPTLPTHVYVALFTVAPADDGTGGTEVTGNNYARAQTSGSDWGSATGSAPSQITNANAITFATPSGSWGTIVFIGLYDALTTGNYLGGGYLGNNLWQPCTITSASPGVFSAHAHGFSNADVLVYTTEFGGTSPTFSQSNLTGLLAAANVTTDTFTVTNSATAVNTSATGNGMVRKVASQAVAINVVVNFASSALIVTLA